MNDHAEEIHDDEDEIFTVTCACCKTEFEGFAPEQANGCAADIRGRVIYGHYGSAVADMTSFRLLDTTAEDRIPAAGQICDACISSLLEEGLIEEEVLPPPSASRARSDFADLEEILIGDDSAEDEMKAL